MDFSIRRASPRARRSGAALIRSLAVAGALASFSLTAATARTSITVAVTSDFVSRNPYGDSTAQMFGIWCQIYGCLGTFDVASGEMRGLLAESWEIDPADHSVWIIRLKKGLKRHVDGHEFTAQDVVHSIWRAKNDPGSKQTSNVADVKTAEAADKYTVRITTTSVTTIFPAEVFDQLIVTSKDLYDTYGPEKADREFARGYGPYSLKQNLIGQRMVLEKNPNWPGIKPQNPDQLIFVRVAEPEARLTGLHNGEIQIASTIPPHLIARLESKKGVRASIAPSAEGMFLGMNSKFPPWNNKLARQAVAYAIDRDLIAKKVFQGHALVLNGPVGEGQFGYSPDLKPKYPYDPQKARALLEQAGLVGTPIELTTTTNRYLYDVQAAEAMVPMLEAAGFKVKFSTPEYATQFSEIQKGNRPFYYHGRGTMMDPTAAMIQMFQTGVTPRIRYSNPEFDRLLEESRTEFDNDKRRAVLQKAFSILQEDMPALWMFRLDIIYGVDENKVSYRPTPHNRVFGTDMTTK